MRERLLQAGVFMIDDMCARDEMTMHDDDQPRKEGREGNYSKLQAHFIVYSSIYSLNSQSTGLLYCLIVYNTISTIFYPY